VILFCLLGAAFFVFVVLGLVRTQLSARLAEMNWEALLSKLKPVEIDAITAVAVEHLNPCSSEAGMKPDDIWNLIGRAEGLSRMRANSDVLIALATYAQRWNYDEGLAVAALLELGKCSLSCHGRTKPASSAL
jgi:hypothetical protein